MTLRGDSSKDKEADARKRTVQELTEIASGNGPDALKARAELARRQEEQGKSTHCWAVAATITGVVAIVIALLAWLFPI